MSCAPPWATKQDAGSASVSDAGNASCPDNAHAGQELVLADLGVVLHQLAPEPAEKGDNTWTVRVKTTAGADVTGAVVTVKPLMPLHGHGTTPAEFMATEPSPGQYQVGPFNLFMPGTWNVPVRVQRTGMPDVEVTFHACIAG